MKDNSFIDTNILIYCYSTTESIKRNKAIEISSNVNVFLSTQVLNEFVNVLSKKFKLNWKSIAKSLNEVVHNYHIVYNDVNTIKSACNVAAKYHYSFYDSLIISSALEADCHFLLSEDLQHNQLIDNKLRILNPFIE